MAGSNEINLNECKVCLSFFEIFSGLGQFLPVFQEFIVGFV